MLLFFPSHIFFSSFRSGLQAGAPSRRSETWSCFPASPWEASTHICWGCLFQNPFGAFPSGLVLAPCCSEALTAWGRKDTSLCSPLADEPSRAEERSAFSSHPQGPCLCFVWAAASWQLCNHRDGDIHTSFNSIGATYPLGYSHSSPPILSESERAWMGSSESRSGPVSLCPCPSLSGSVNHGSFPCKPGEKGVTGLPAIPTHAQPCSAPSLAYCPWFMQGEGKMVLDDSRQRRGNWMHSSLTPLVKAPTSNLWISEVAPAGVSLERFYRKPVIITALCAGPEPSMQLIGMLTRQRLSAR